MPSGQYWGGLKKMAHVSNLFLAVEHRSPMKAVDQTIALADRGVEGCIHGRNGSKRQLLLVDSETLTEFQLAPGVVRENITTAGPTLALFNSRKPVRSWDGLLGVT